MQQKHLEKIRTDFGNVNSKENLVDLLNYVKRLFVPPSDNPKVFSVKALNYFAFSKNKDSLYSEFHIKKKNGGERKIAAPENYLKYVLKNLNIILNVVYDFHPKANGFVPNKSVVTNAQQHIGKNYVYNIDLKDFFPSINFRRIKAVLELPPLKLNDELAFMIANLVTYNGYLTQGAPTSPTISNIVAERLDRRLNGLAKKYNCHYTRYADDITFSSDHNIYKSEGAFIKKMRKIVEKENFQINPAKTRLQRRNYKQEVTGITVNEKTNVPRRYIREIRAILNNWEKRGFKYAENTFKIYYHADKGHVKKFDPYLVNVLEGKLDYLKMVRGEKDTFYRKYKKQFDFLFLKDRIWSEIHIKDLISLIEREGLENIIQMFKTEISNKKEFSHDQSSPVIIYQIFYKDQKFWLKSSDFENKIEEYKNHILLRRRVKIVEKSNKNGIFKVLIPKVMNHSNSTSKKAEATTGKQPAKDDISFNVNNKDKASFIRALLDYGNKSPISFEDKERVYSLIEKELGHEGVSIEEVHEIVNDVLNKEVGTIKPNSKPENQNTNPSEQLTIISISESADSNNYHDVKTSDNRILKLNPKIKDFFENELKKNKGVLPDGWSISDNNKLMFNDHNPITTSQFLRELSERDVFRKAIHPHDDSDEFDLNVFRENLEKEFENLQKKYSSLKTSKGLQTKIWSFLISDYSKNRKGWSKNHIKMGWGSKELDKWCQENPGVWPNVNENIQVNQKGFWFSEQKKYGDKKYFSFNEIINAFKKQIEIRPDLNNDFVAILKPINNKYRDVFKYNYDKVTKRIRFFCDVEKFLEGYHILIKEGYNFYKKNLNAPYNKKWIEFYLNEKELNNKSVIQLEMVFPGSEYGYTFESFKAKRGGYESDVKEKLRSVCDWSIEAKFGCGQSLKVDMMNDKQHEYIGTEINYVKHILTFYRG